MELLSKLEELLKEDGSKDRSKHYSTFRLLHELHEGTTNRLFEDLLSTKPKDSETSSKSLIGSSILEKDDPNEEKLY